jgi:photosystem II stability/assembly factor-like uncharacterized protein
MKSKLLIYALPVLITIYLFYGYGISDDKPKREWTGEQIQQVEKSVLEQPYLETRPGTSEILLQDNTNPITSMQRIVLSEGFENGPYTADSLPIGWAKVKVNPTTCVSPPADWRVRDSGKAFCGTNTVPAFTTKAYGNTRKSLSIPWTSSSSNFTDDWVFTPGLQIETGDSLIFFVQLGTWPAGGTYYSDSLQVWVTSGQTPATQIARLGTVSSLPAATNMWQERKFDLSAYNGQTINLAFRYNMNVTVNGIMVNVDSVMVRNMSATPSVNCNYTYASQTSGVVSTLYSVSAASDMVAWAAGVAATVRRTTDGGSTWTNANPTPGVIVGDIYNIFAMDANTAFVTTSPSATFIYKTVNGGTTWTQVYTLAGGFINGIEMVSPLIGFAQGDPTPAAGNWVILTTVDGGNSWTRMPTEPSGAGEAGWNNSFQAMGTNIWYGTNNTKVWRSTNLGLTWSSSPTTGTLNTYGIHFNNSMNGVAGGNAGVYSTDGGATWLTSPVPGTGNITGGIAGGLDDFWVCRGSSMYRSSNNGQTWITAPVHTAAGTLWDMSSVIGTNGCPTAWAVGASGVIAKVTGDLVGVTNVSTEIPSSYTLKQNFPNPFNPTTNIYFALPQSGFVTLKVYDMTGKEIATLVNEVRTAGSYIVDFDASRLSSGAYFYKLQSGNFTDTKKMMLIK